MIRRWLVAPVLALCLGGAGGAAGQPLGPSSLSSPSAPPGPAPSTWGFYPGFVFGYDSFGQHYSIAERDTLDLVDELSGRLVAALERRGRLRFGVKNSFGVGQQATRDDAWIHLGAGGKAIELRAEQELHYKAYAANADFAESSDYLAGISRAGALWRFAPRWRLRLEDRLEWTTFAEPTSYSYDYRLNDASATIEREYGLFSLVALGYGYGNRSVPDSSAIDFHRHVVRADWQHGLGRVDLDVDQRFERRLFRDPLVRSPYSEYDAELFGGVRLHPKVRLRPDYRVSVVEHDRPDSIYSDVTDQSVELLLEGDASRSTILGLGPRAEFRRTANGFDRAYNQWGLKGTVSCTLGTLWLQFIDEVGSRQHLAGESLFFTDYIYNWSTLYLAWNPLPRVGFDLYFTVAPEVHEFGEDDNTLLLLSASVTYGWR